MLEFHQPEGLILHVQLTVDEVGDQPFGVAYMESSLAQDFGSVSTLDRLQSARVLF